MLARNSAVRVAARNWLTEHKGAQGWYMMLKSPDFWREIHRVEKWRFLTKFMPYTMVPYPGLSCLFDLLTDVEKRQVPGALVECGVWRGGCAAIMATFAVKSGRKTHLFDSFEGLPEPIEKDGALAIKRGGGKTGGQLKPVGTTVASLEEVRALFFDRLHFSEREVILYKGWFQHTLPTASPSIGPIAVLRLDGDWYESTRVCLENLYHHVVEGGIVIVDDYDRFDGCRRATDEFLEKQGSRQQLRREGSVYFRKL